MLTNSELIQIKNFLALYGKKDSQLSNANEVTSDDYIAIIQNSENKRIALSTILKKLVSDFADYVSELDPNVIDLKPIEESEKLVTSGGVYEAIEDAKNSEHVDTDQLKNGSVTTSKLRDYNVTTDKIANKNVTEDKLSNALAEKINRASEVKDGKSAYEIAVEEGFEGTIEEWLESLKGEKGDSGDLIFPSIEFLPITGELVIIGKNIESNFDFDYQTGELIFIV